MLILLACAIAVGSVFFAVRSSKQEKNATATKNVNELTALAERAKDVDTDSDGLKDWEEELWRTDPKKADSDGDGTNDNQEISEGRNPAKANTAGQGKPANDKAESSAIAFASTTADAENLSDTEKFSRELFTKYMDFKAKGKTLTEQDQLAMVQQLLASNTLKPQATAHALSEVKVSTDSSADAFRRYGNELGRYLKADSPKSQDELSIFGTALENGDQELIKKLDPIIEGYTKLVNHYLGMRVPQEVAREHINFVNAMSAVLDDIKGMRNVWEDPIRGYVAFDRYPEDGLGLAKALVELRTAFKNRGIYYGQNEDGWELFKNL